MDSTARRLIRIFETLLESFGKRHWWPGDTVVEIIIGAILTQNTSWKNVSKAIQNMKEHGVLDIAMLKDIEPDVLADIIKPSGYYNVKTTRIKSFINMIHDKYDGSIEYLMTIDTNRLREIFLGVNGIGPETADSMLLYAFDRPIFVIDAYTKRFLKNHGLYDGADQYDDIQRFFMRNLPLDTYLFNEYHALIVYLCQQCCRKKPICSTCPLEFESHRFPC